MGEDGVEHLDDETLLGARQTLDTLDLLLQFRAGPRLAGCTSFLPMSSSSETASASAICGRSETGTTALALRSVLPLSRLSRSVSLPVADLVLVCVGCTRDTVIYGEKRTSGSATTISNRLRENPRLSEIGRAHV